LTPVFKFRHDSAKGEMVGHGCVCVCVCVRVCCVCVPQLCN